MKVRMLPGKSLNRYPRVPSVRTAENKVDKLLDSVTRDIEFLDTPKGEWAFTIKEHGKPIYHSDIYESREECFQVGMDMMDIFHQKAPLLTDRTESGRNGFEVYPRKAPRSKGDN
jgi:hypothetical protein